jgi:hypothetical protein
MNRKRGRESFYLLFSASPFFNFILCLFMPNMGSRHATNSDKHKKKSPQVYQWHMIAHGRILKDGRHHSFNFPWIRESITKRREESGGKQSGVADHHMGDDGTGKIFATNLGSDWRWYNPVDILGSCLCE